MTRWLTDEEQRTWRAFVEMQRDVIAAIEGQLMRDSDMPAAYYGILVALSEAPERRLRMSSLAEAVDGSQSRLSHAVGRLERRGWVERVRCPSDRRGWYAVLSDAGMEVLRSAAPGHVECVRSSIFDALSQQQQQDLFEIASTLTQHLRSDASPTAGEPTADEATADEATADEATADEPTADEPTADEAIGVAEDSVRRSVSVSAESPIADSAQGAAPQPVSARG